MHLFIEEKKYKTDYLYIFINICFKLIILKLLNYPWHIKKIIWATSALNKCSYIYIYKFEHNKKNYY